MHRYQQQTSPSPSLSLQPNSPLLLSFLTWADVDFVSLDDELERSESCTLPSIAARDVDTCSVEVDTCPVDVDSCDVDVDTAEPLLSVLVSEIWFGN
eukprot:1320029-Amorphochlora_amoeboformis.AAC.1